MAPIICIQTLTEMKKPQHSPTARHVWNTLFPPWLAMFPILLYASASDSSSLEFVHYINSVIIITIIVSGIFQNAARSELFHQLFTAIDNWLTAVAETDAWTKQCRLAIALWHDFCHPIYISEWQPVICRRRSRMLHNFVKKHPSYF